MKKKTVSRFLGLALSGLMVLGVTACGSSAGSQEAAADQSGGAAEATV